MKSDDRQEAIDHLIMSVFAQLDEPEYAMDDSATVCALEVIASEIQDRLNRLKKKPS